DRSLDRKFQSVHAQSRKLAEATHRPASGFAESADVLGMRGTEALRDKSAELLPHSFGSRAAEHPLGRSVEKDDALIIVHGDDRVHRRRDNARKPLLAQA